MKASQQFTTIDEQIKRLKSRGLSINNEETAYELLSTYGYFNIINGYKEPYIFKTEVSAQYIPGTTFEQIYSLFCLDHAIRNQILLLMLDLEEHLRSVTSYVIAESFGIKEEDYLKYKNYQNRSSSNPRFALPNILDSLKNATLSNKNPIKYYRENYHNVPPWVLFKGVFLSTLVNFIRLQKPKQKSDIIVKMYDIKYESIDKYIKDLFTDTLFLCLEFRNLAAHGGRIYNYIPSSSIRVSLESEKILNIKITNFANIHKVHSLGTLVCMLDLFKRKTYSKSLKKVIESEIKKHFNIYPNDLPYLLESTGIKNIIHTL